MQEAKLEAVDEPAEGPELANEDPFSQHVGNTKGNSESELRQLPHPSKQQGANAIAMFVPGTVHHVGLATGIQLVQAHVLTISNGDPLRNTGMQGMLQKVRP